jgi:hypothetical protein
VTVYPGTNDDGTGLNTPQYGLSVTGSSSVSYSASFFHAATAGFFDGGGNATVERGLNIQERTGTTAAPVVVTRGLHTYGSNGDSLDVPGHVVGIAQPREHGAIAWTCDPTSVPTGQAPAASGTVYLAALYVPRTATATKLFWGINSPAGATPTAGQNFVGIYNQSGTLLTSVNVDARVTATGVFTETISVSFAPGMYWVAFLFNATTLPSVYRGDGLTATVVNFNLGATSLRFASNATAQTTLPATIVPANNVAVANAYWVAIA